jgi:hypothetical protein
MQGYSSRGGVSTEFGGVAENQKAWREPIRSVLIEKAASGVSAARSFQIDEQVLQTIGMLSSTKGDETTARKATAGGQFQELAGSEKQWLEEAIRRVVHRLGEHDSGAPLIPISLRDLPNL